jgi:predicted RNase H-like HicB family nuclease
MAHYVGILDGDGEVWGVRVPDMPGCHGGGTTPEEALTDAVSAMSEWAETMAAKGRPIPAARTLAEVAGDPDSDFDPSRESTVLLPLLIDTGRPVKANVSMDAGLLSSIDEAAKRRGMTRSAFLAAAARAMITDSAG